MKETRALRREPDERDASMTPVPARGRSDFKTPKRIRDSAAIQRKDAWAHIPRRYRASYLPCPDCGGPMARHAYRCRACTPLIQARAAVRWKGDAASPTTKRARARRLYPVLGMCESCELIPARDRHHIDGDPGNNKRENIAFLCRVCHMELDGRLGAFLMSAPRTVHPPKPCVECGKEYKPLRKGLCHACNERGRRRRAREALRAGS